MKKIYGITGTILTLVALLLLALNIYNYNNNPFVYYKYQLSNVRDSQLFVNNYVVEKTDDKIDVNIYIVPKYNSDSLLRTLNITSNDAIQFVYKDLKIEDYNNFKDSLISDINNLTAGKSEKEYTVIKDVRDVDSLYTQIDSTGTFGITTGFDIISRFFMPFLALLFGVFALNYSLTTAFIENTENEKVNKNWKYKLITFLLLFISILFSSLSYFKSEESQFNSYYEKSMKLNS